MCGRTACSLSRESIIRATAYKDNTTNQYIRYEWYECNQKEDKSMNSYEPNFNQTSGHYLPVLVSKKLIDNTCDDSNVIVLTSMRWGLRPDWIKSEDNSFKVNPINCRFEKINEKKLFSSPLKSGRRCVVLVDGFFEWKTTNKTKEPYFLYFPQKYIDYKNRDISWSQNQLKLSENDEWRGPRLLSMAAIFNKSADNSISFAIITVPIHTSLEWLHNRMPAILDSNDKIKDWLQFSKVSPTDALKLLSPFGGLQYHSVSPSVSNVKNNSIANLLPKQSNGGQKTIDQWFPRITPKKCLQKDIKKEEEEEEDNCVKTKRLKQ